MTFDATAPQRDSLSFDASPTGAPGQMTCAECAGPIHAYYYEAGGRVLCARCQEKVKAGSGGSFGRALLFGAGAALAGAVAYYAITKALDAELGIIAALLGLGVGYAVHLGSGRAGGRKYQIAAVILTYLSIGLAYTPFAASAMREGGQLAKKHQAAMADSLRAAIAGGDTAVIGVVARHADRLGIDTAAAAQATSGVQLKPAAAKRKTTMFESPTFAAVIWLVGPIVMPILFILGSLPGGAISALIIFFGMRRAWRMNAGNGASASSGPVTGPYRVAGAR